MTRVYECVGFEFVTRGDANDLVLYYDDEQIELRRTRSGSGERFEGKGRQLWLKGNAATLNTGERQYRDCEYQPLRGPWEDARRRGVRFRAVGQEPGWVLEIKPNGQILLEADYGATRYLFDTPEPIVDGDSTLYQAEQGGHNLIVEINADWCQDSMSGEVFSNRVILNLNGRELRGCGESLSGEWR